MVFHQANITDEAAAATAPAGLLLLRRLRSCCCYWCYVPAGLLLPLRIFACGAASSPLLFLSLVLDGCALLSVFLMFFMAGFCLCSPTALSAQLGFPVTAWVCLEPPGCAWSRLGVPLGVPGAALGSVEVVFPEMHVYMFLFLWW